MGLILLWTFLQTPYGQNKVLPLALSSISKALGTPISASEINISFFDEIHLDDVIALDLEGDTLVYIEKLDGDIGVFSFFQKQLKIDALKIKGATINLNEIQNGTFNYSHILKHLNSGVIEKKNEDVKPWDIDLNKLNIENINFNYWSKENSINASIPSLNGDFSNFSIDESIYELSKLNIDGITLDYNKKGFQQKEDSIIQFPSLPFSLAIQDLSINGKEIRYNNSTQEFTSTKFDSNHIGIESVNLKGNNFNWNDSIIFNVEELKLKLEDDFEITQLTSNISLSNQKLSLKNTTLKTLTSTLELNGIAEFNSFDALLNDMWNTNSNLTVRNALISKKDIDYFFNNKAFSQININVLEDIVIEGNFQTDNRNLFTKNLSIYSGNLYKLIGSSESYHLSESPTHSFNISKFSTSHDFLSKFLPTLKLPSTLNNLGLLSGNIKGQIDSKEVKFNSISINSSHGTALSGSGRIYQLDNPNGPAIDFNFKKLQTNINSLLSDPANIPESIRKFEDVVYIGSIKGNLTHIMANGNLFTSLGNLELDANAQFNDNYTDAIYSGYFNLQDFDLGHMLNDSTLGLANFKGNLTGSGLSIQDLKADLDGTVKAFCYDGYIYNDIVLDGSYQDSIFIGNVSSKDKNLNLDIDGKIDFKGPTTNMEVTMNLRNMDLKELGFASDDMSLGGIFKGKVQGSSIDDFIGKGDISGFSVKTDKGMFISDSIVSLNVTAINQNAKSYAIDSPFLEAEILGKIKPSTLIRFIKNYIKAYIPVEIGYDIEVEDDLDKYFEENEDQNFILSAKTKDINTLLEPFFGDKIEMKQAKLGVNFSSENTRLDIKGKFDSLLYNGILFQHGSYFFDGRKSFINGNVNIQDISMDNEILVPITTINTTLNNKVANFNMVLSNEDDEERLNFWGDMTRTDEYIFTFNDSIYLNGSTWKFSPYNQIIYGDYGLYMQDVNLSKDDQAITIYTDENENGEAIEVLFDNFILSELTSIIDKENEYVEGKIDGSLVINSLYSKPFITANLDLSDITISGHQAGTLSIQAAQDIATNSVNSKISLFGSRNDASMILAYGIEDQSTKGTFDVKKLEMAVIDPYLTNLFIESEGYISGKITIDGDLNNLDLKGTLSTHDVKTTPVFTNSRYAVSDANITFSDTEIDFGNIELKDRKGNSAYVTGKIQHKNLRKSIVNLKVATTNFEFLNTTSTENELFYGNVIVSGNATITGPFDDIEIDGAVSAVNKSNLNISPLSIESELLNDDFIIYSGDPREIPFDSLKIEIKPPSVALPFDIDLKVNVNDDSEFSMILNPITGDKLTCNGNSNLILKLNKKGEMELFGTYTVTKGTYSFSYGIISKEFKILPGSTVTLNGDPLKGLLDVDAVYVANTTVYDLIKLESDLSDAQRSEAQRKRNINVVLNLSNNILKPNINLDITTDNNDPSSISDILTKKLAQLRTEPDELNNQVFGLLLFNNFILAKNAETDLAKTGTDLAIRSISGLISSELNKLADGLLQGFEVNFDFDSYSSDFLAQGQEGVITELGLGVKQTLFDDRLTISAGTNINLETSSQNSDFSTIAGDFVLEYKLNKNGNYIIKAFRKSSFDRLIDENASKTGASFFIRKEFGTIEKKKN